MIPFLQTGEAKRAPIVPPLLLAVALWLALAPCARAQGAPGTSSDATSKSAPEAGGATGDKTGGAGTTEGPENKKKPEKPLHAPLPPPEKPGTARPIPAALPESVRAFPALQLLAGTPQFSVRVSETEPDITLDPGKGFAHGAFFGVDWVGEYLRAGYFRLVYLHDLPEGTRIRGRSTGFLRIESNEFWTHGGIRPFDSLYAGVGLGVQERRIHYGLSDRVSERVVLETVYSTGLLLEYAVGQPFVLQIRYVHDLPGAHLETDGLLILFAYTVPL
jgi:hypothetical protein